MGTTELREVAPPPTMDRQAVEVMVAALAQAMTSWLECPLYSHQRTQPMSTHKVPTRRRQPRPRRGLDERLLCEVVSLDYDFREHTGRLYMPEFNCCDMTGCLGVFRGIDPEVALIQTYSGDRPDTIYRRKGTEWTAYWPRRQPAEETT